MSLYNLSIAYARMGLRVRLAEDQCRDFERVLAQWFLDSDPCARDFLRAIAIEYRQGHPVSGAVAANVKALLAHP